MMTIKLARIGSQLRAWLALLPALALASAAAVAAPDSVKFREGSLPRSWDVSAKCSEVPDFQVHEYNPDFYILRQSGCSHDEKPFIYLLFGTDKAFLLDTGAGPAKPRTAPVDVVGTVDAVIRQWLAAHDRASIPLVVAHLHSHGDHTAGDPDFAARPDTILVKSDVEVMKPFFGITQWPDEVVPYDLGGRVLDIISIPGHDVNSIAVYDRQTGVLLTGDSLYPGRVYVNGDPNVFKASNQRLVDFVKGRTVTHILGTHIEQTRTPFVDYPVGTIYQPDEHVLELGVGQLLELNDALVAMGDQFTPRRFADFSVCGHYPTCEAQPVEATQ